MTSADTELERLETERSRRDLSDLDSRSAHEIVEQIAADDATVPAAVAAVSDEIAAAVTAVAERIRGGGRLIYVGAGTPGRLAVVDASECAPTFGVDPGRVVALMAGGSATMTAAVEGIEDDATAGAADIAATAAGPDDAVVGITASGRTPYVLAAVDEASRRGCVTIGVSNNENTQLSGRVDIGIETLTGPEVIAGSTRMKAGTAQKLVLNTLSSATMISLGKTYGNLMVDVAASNEKLRARTRRIVVEATGAADDAAAALLEQADWQAKPAIVALLADIDVEGAISRLRDCDGHVRAALRGHGNQS